MNAAADVLRNVPSPVASEAAVFLGARQVRSEVILVPAPAPNEIRVRLEGCGMCASNTPVWEGRPWFSYPYTPGAPGHEGWGVIDAVGDEVTDFTTGDRVALLSTKAYAQYDVAPADQAIRLPAELDGQAVPAEPIACAMNIFRRSDVREGQTVAIVGIGFLGALLTQLCVRAGARVVGLSRRNYARAVAEQAGAIATYDTEDLAKAVRSARSHSGDAGFDRVIEAIGTQGALDLATELVGTRARLVIAGYHQDAPRQINMQRWNWLGLDVVNAHERDPAVYLQGMREAFARMADGTIHPERLLTHRYPLADIGRGFEALHERPPGFMKAYVVCN